MRRSYSSNGSDRRERALVLGGAGFILLVLLLGRLFALQVVASESSQEQARRNWLRPEYVPGPRGRILDRNGVILAEMVPSFSIAIDPHYTGFVRNTQHFDVTLEHLAELIGGDPERYKKLVDRQRRVSYKPVRLERNADSVTVARVEENRFTLPGVSVEVEHTRRYPADSLAAHVLGYVGEIGEKELERLGDAGYRLGSLIGKTGIEFFYEDQLRGEEGIRFVEVNALGRRSEAFRHDPPVPPRPGRDVILSLDANLQRVAEEALNDAGFDGEGKKPEVRGAAVLVDVRTGEVLAAASRPGYDLNIFSRSISQDEWEALTRAGHPLLNRVIQAAYPPGSVFKPITQYAALAEGVVQPGQYLNPCFGRHRFGNRYFRCWKRSGHGPMNSIQAMENSCDIYFYQLAPGLGVDGISRYSSLFQINERTGIDLPQERKSLVPDSGYYNRRFGEKKWSRGVALNLIIGQGEILLTPLQLAQYTGVLATGGRRQQPRLLKALGPELRRRPSPESTLDPVYTDIPLNRRALNEVRAGMAAAVATGTAKRCQIPGYAVAGKTGTAENPGYDHALFIAYAPIEDPEVAIAVVMENRGHGGSVAAPVANKVLRAYFGVSDSLIVELAETD